MTSQFHLNPLAKSYRTQTLKTENQRPIRKSTTVNLIHKIRNQKYQKERKVKSKSRTYRNKTWNFFYNENEMHFKVHRDIGKTLVLDGRRNMTMGAKNLAKVAIS